MNLVKKRIDTSETSTPVLQRTMRSVEKWPLFLAVATNVLALASGQNVNPGLSIKKLDRTIDLSSSLVKIDCAIELSNDGQTEVKSFHWTTHQEAGREGRVAFIEATVSRLGS